MKPTNRKSLTGNLLMWTPPSRSNEDRLGPLLQGQMRIAKLKSAYISLIIDPRGLQCETNLWDIMAWKSSDVVRFDLGLLLQGQTMVHWLWCVVFPVDTNLHRFSNA